MKRLETKLKQLQSAHSMSLSEKEQMCNALKEYVELKPVRAPTRGVRSPLSMQLLWQHKLVSATLVLALFFSSGAGAVYASTDSLPGEALYSVKELVEEVHERILLSDEAKAELAEKLTERREHEAERLQALGKLDEARMAIIDRRMARHKQRAERVLAKLEHKAPAKVARIRAKLADKSINMHNLKKQRLLPFFNSLMQQIESDYSAQELSLLELEQELKELDNSY